MTNPNNAVGTNGAYGGRTSVNAFNDFMNIVTSGIISGWDCAPNSGLTVSLGGSGTSRDAAAAQDNAGNKTSINNISGSPIDVTLSAAPGTNSRIDSIVAYVDNPPNGDSSVADNPDACGIIAVAGTPASSPVAPDDSAIRTAITADGASGTTAYYVVLANITMAAGTTDITSNMIKHGAYAAIGAQSIGYNTIPEPVTNTYDGGNGYKSLTPNTRTKLFDYTVSGLDPNWQYQLTIDLGTIFVPGSATGLVDVMTGTTALTPSQRIRCGNNQSTPSWTTIMTPSTSQITMSVYATSDASGTNNFYIESVHTTFIPIRPIS